MTDRFGNARVLVVAGSDSGGGAGIQADLKAVMALGGYCSTAITALTAQNTRGVQDVHTIPPGFVAAQMRSVLADIGADCVKTGMLHDTAVIDAVAAELDALAPGVPLVVDPVMVAQSGDRLLAEAAAERLGDVLLPRATLLTPNLPEAEVLLGRSVPGTEAGLREAARALRGFGPGAVLVKGGHAAGEEVIDCLATPDGEMCFRSRRIDTTSNHGTGCTLASAIAAGVARELPMADAVARARDYLQEALRTARGLGSGAGPVNHAFNVPPY
ncbi:MAG: bifunctional hydroxymethylpyrimidine kinase/phosphomethylpyrimidine kinase [Halorhodospira halophila]|uniref:bifunctional hydroxymethylpyrimidine kinase/phosphomethylpyrimidine kinase n=1 Tax=Halorhodospira TaxID=85108 RepID=UPI0019113F62|nr:MULTISPECIES: bifunctional hydroxymethylpyrimidine kinase/phosphomethylpyrimidine kinase [Halorhodospira]MBK5942464.1 bifunctional hydroxymethylpyrimidine kinase/phosphomethylpyrimidine kinase [Halorhodospira halophila]MCC3750634.1 bifunctional hydroxymethylpyrimidine kinase/phosphomethylpyrimidine kinase [Halorhodospira halophila]MCG5528245.1 bifunctional hydroxymethylpyrimidine kinase/phosphomethylpyrimidine kinase [Halorhodospira halophila]MCG5532014.1 bifunctional hydroxymethylpyrimidine